MSTANQTESISRDRVDEIACRWCPSIFHLYIEVIV